MYGKLSDNFLPNMFLRDLKARVAQWCESILLKTLSRQILTYPERVALVLHRDAKIPGSIPVAGNFLLL
jgi:hypothetical protein